MNGASASRRTVRAYLLSIGIWSALSLLSGWQYLIFDHSVNIHSTLSEMILLAEARGLAFALLTPPIFYIVGHYSSGSRRLLRYLLAYVLGAGPFMVIYACIRWVVLPPWSAPLQGFVSRRTIGPFAVIHEGFADIITVYIATLMAAHAYNYLERVRRQDLERSEYEQALFIDPGAIVAVHAEGNYVLLQREADSYLLRESISVLTEKLKPYGFIRIHRSVLVNSALVEEIQPLPSGEYRLRVRGGKECTVTRSYKKNLKEMAAAWIGVDQFVDH